MIKDINRAVKFIFLVFDANGIKAIDYIKEVAAISSCIPDFSRAEYGDSELVQVANFYCTYNSDDRRAKEYYARFDMIEKVGRETDSKVVEVDCLACLGHGTDIDSECFVCGGIGTLPKAIAGNIDELFNHLRKVGKEYNVEVLHREPGDGDYCKDGENYADTISITSREYSAKYLSKLKEKIVRKFVMKDRYAKRSSKKEN